MKRGLHGEVKEDTHGEGTYGEETTRRMERGIHKEGANTEWGEWIHTKKERRILGEGGGGGGGGGGHGEGTQENTRVNNQQLTNCFILFSDELLQNTIYSDQLYPI